MARVQLMLLSSDAGVVTSQSQGPVWERLGRSGWFRTKIRATVQATHCTRRRSPGRGPSNAAPSDSRPGSPRCFPGLSWQGVHQKPSGLLWRPHQAQLRRVRSLRAPRLPDARRNMRPCRLGTACNALAPDARPGGDLVLAVSITGGMGLGLGAARAFTVTWFSIELFDVGSIRASP